MLSCYQCSILAMKLFCKEFNCRWLVTLLTSLQLLSISCVVEQLLSKRFAKSKSLAFRIWSDTRLCYWHFKCSCLISVSFLTERLSASASAQFSSNRVPACNDQSGSSAPLVAAVRTKIYVSNLSCKSIINVTECP